MKEIALESRGAKFWKIWGIGGRKVKEGEGGNKGWGFSEEKLGSGYF